MSIATEIVVTKGPKKGSVFPLSGSSPVTIGRAPGNTLVLDDERVAPHQAQIDVTFSGVTVKELGSRNGIYVGHERIVGSKKLLPGVEVRLGSTALELRERRDTTAREVVLAPAAHASHADLTR